MLVNPTAKTLLFNFAPGKMGRFSEDIRGFESQQVLQGLFEEPPGMMEERGFWPEHVDAQSIKSEFLGLLSSSVGTALVSPNEIELTDGLPVRSQPYRSAPSKLKKFLCIVNEYVELGLITPSKSPYDSLAFLVPMGGDAFRMVLHYRKVNSKIVFDSYPMPTIDQAFDKLGGVVAFSVFYRNSGYYQIPLSTRSRWDTAFCTTFGLFKFNKLQIGISIVSQGFSRVIDEFFADLKGKSVLHFLDDYVVYSSSVDEHASHVHELLRRTQDTGFTLYPHKVTLRAIEIKYLGHQISPAASVCCPKG
jgi:hypothetical protein